MDNPGLFDFPPTTRLHRERTRKIHTILSTDAQPQPRPTDLGPAADYCLAHHALEGAESAARSGERATFDWYAANPHADAATSSTPTTLGPRVVVAPDLTDLPRSPISETPYYVLGPGTEAAPLGLRTLAADAFATAADTGFGTLLAAHAVVVVLLRTKQLGQTLDSSWTITRLPGTRLPRPCRRVGRPGPRLHPRSGPQLAERRPHRHRYQDRRPGHLLSPLGSRACGLPSGSSTPAGPFPSPCSTPPRSWSTPRATCRAS